MIHEFLSNPIVHARRGEGNDPIDATILEQVWSLAETHGDERVLAGIVGLDQPLPPPVFARAELCRLVPVRVGFLARADVSVEMRDRLLSSERRSDVFAGLVEASKGRPDLQERLFAQMKAKPTKVLAKALVKGDVTDPAIRLECLRVLHTDKSLSDQISRRLHRFVAALAEVDEMVADMSGWLNVEFLLSIPFERVPGEHLLTVVDRCAEFAAKDMHGYDWHARRRQTEALRFLVNVSGRKDLTDDVVARLREVASSGGSDDEYARISASLALRASTGVTKDDDRLRARNATGDELKVMLDAAYRLGDPATSSTTQGLLENPNAYELPDFPKLLDSASQGQVIEAIRETKSHDLVVLCWQTSVRLDYEAIWPVLPDTDVLLERMFRHTLSSDQHYRTGSDLVELLSLGASLDLVGSVPFRHFDVGSWRSAHLYHAAGRQLDELMRRHLGSSQAAWENFNNLATGWSGTLLELLEASSTL